MHPPLAVLQGLLEGEGLWKHVYRRELYLPEGPGVCLQLHGDLSLRIGRARRPT